MIKKMLQSIHIEQEKLKTILILITMGIWIKYQ